MDYERHGLTAEEIARQYPQLSLAQVHSALAYYFDHKDELTACLLEDQELANTLSATLPSPLDDNGNSSDSDAISS